MRSSSWLLASAVAFLPAVRAAPPERVEIAYEVFRDGSRIAEVVDRFEHGSGRYRIVETWRGRGIYSFAGEIVRSSEGSLDASGPRPDAFSDERSRRAPVRTTFDWTARSLVTQRKGETQSLALPHDAQDRLSFLLALAFAPPDGKAATFSVTDGNGLSTYVYEAVKRETVQVVAGEFEALKVARRPQRADDRRETEIWLARELGYLPVRIVLTDKDGVRLDQQAARVRTP
jgi:hypothetical protein